LAPIGGTPGRFSPEQDETQLWSALRQAEDKIAPPSAVYQDPRLTEYLTGLGDRLAPSYRDAGGPPIRVLVRKDPRLNAGAMAQGLIVVNTGILARVDNEAQLAAVLGHEMTHVINRHQIREYRALQNRQTAINVAAFLGTLALTAAAIDQSQRGHPEAAQAIAAVGAPLLLQGLKLSYAAMVSGYSRDMEREADENGQVLMAKAGYDPREMVRFFRTLLSESPDRGAIETFFWGNHPRTSERIETADSRAKEFAYTSLARADNQEFETRTRPLRLANAQYDAYLGRMSIARAQMDRSLQSLPEGPAKGLIRVLLEGNVYASGSVGAKSRRDTQSARDYLARAQTSYRRVITQGSSDSTMTQMVAVAYKSLGLLYQAHLDFGTSAADARDALEKYLELAPNASDRATITEKLRELSRDSVGPRSPARPGDSTGGKDSRPACAFGMYWSSVKDQCTKIGE